MRRQEGQVGLVLHLLQPVEDERGPRVAVDAEPPDFAQPLGVGGVASVDRQLNRVALGIGAGEGGHAPFLVGRGTQPVHLDLKVAYGRRHLRRRRESVRRAQGEVGRGRRAPADDHRGNDAEGKPVGADHRAEPGQRHGADHNAVHRATEVRHPGERHRGGDGELDDRETWVEAGELRDGRATSRRAQQRVEEKADEHGGQTGGRHLPNGLQPRDEKAEEDQCRGDAE